MSDEQKSMEQIGAEMAGDPEQRSARGSLSHDENLRATALSLACRYYVETIVKDGELYREMVRDNQVLKPATYLGVIEVAINFEAFISGEIKRTAEALVQADADQVETPESGAIAAEEPASAR